MDRIESGSCATIVDESAKNGQIQDVSHLSEDGYGHFNTCPVQTSTPTSNHSSRRENRLIRVRNSSGLTGSSTSVSNAASDDLTEVNLRDDDDFDPYKVPILGYETIEERGKFTVFRLEVQKSEFDSWFIFRRYSDFERLKRQIKRIFPNVSLTLPSKKWFGDNFDTSFLDERKEGLQNFINGILSNKEVHKSAPVTQFFCLDEPPGPYESLEESRALCESLEDQVYRLTTQLQEKDAKIRSLEARLLLSNQRISDAEKAVCSHCVSALVELKKQQEVDSNDNLTQ